MLKRLRFYKAYFNAYQTQQFLTWKQHKQYAQKEFYSRFCLNFIFLYCLIKLIPYINSTNIQIQQYFFIPLHLILQIIRITSSLIKEINQRNKNYLLDIMLFLEQILFSYQIVFILQTKFDQFLLGMLAIISIRLYSNMIISLLSLLITLILYSIFGENNLSYIALPLILLIMIKNENEYLIEYNIQMTLLNIIKAIPNAMCIVNNDKTQLLFSNDQFNKLSSSLILKNSDVSNIEMDSNYQLQFLNKLHLREMKPNELQYENDIICDEGKSSGELLKVKKIIFHKNESEKEFNSMIKIRKPISTQSRTAHPIVDLFQSYEHLNENNFKRSTYTSNIMIQVDMFYNASHVVSSAIKKRKVSMGNRHKNSSILSANNSIRQHILSGLDSKNQSIGQRISKQDLDDKTATISQEIKLMVDQMETCQFISTFEEQEKFQIYFLQDMTPYILKNRIKMLESVKKNLMRSISHELLTYLNGAYGYIYEMKQNFQISDFENLKNWCNQAFKYITLQIHKINDLIDYRDIINKHFKISEETFRLDVAITDCLHLFEDQIDQKQLYLNYDPVPIEVKGDKQKFCQVFLNLMSNAIKHTFHGGITITAKEIESITDYIQLNQNHQSPCSLEKIDSQFEDSVIEISVQDTGIGMEEDQLAILIKKALNQIIININLATST